MEYKNSRVTVGFVGCSAFNAVKFLTLDLVGTAPDA